MVLNLVKPRSFHLDDTCKLWLPFHKYGLENTKIIDKSQFHNDGIIHGAVPGEKGWDFDGSDDYVNCGNDSSLNFTNKITIEIWIKPNLGSSSFKYILGKTASFVLGINDDEDRIMAFLYIGGNWTAERYGTTNGIKTDVWQHIALVYNGTSGGVKFYINGNLNANPAQSGDLDTTGNVLVIGSLTGGAEFFNGTIGEARTYNRTLSPEEIQNHIQIERHRYGV